MGSLWVDGGVSVVLGAVLARAGEGVVYEVVGRPEWVAKIFHEGLKDRDVKCAKVAAMVGSPPGGAVQSDGFVVLTWPLQVVVGEGGPVGYVMRRIDTADAVEIHTVSNPSNRVAPLPGAPQWTPHVSWLHLVNVAANLCLAVDVVHRVDAVIGDFQERNILVGDTTRVSLVDCDSMQFTDGGGRSFLCGVGRAEFTAPELAGLNLAVVAREKPSDLFALAVHIHLLLMAGNHPFLRGVWTGRGEQPDALSLAKSGYWAGGPGSLLQTHPLAPSMDFLPDHVQRLFVRAFTEGAVDPSRRPSAAEWRAGLQALPVRTCGRGHQVPVETEWCPWCRIDDERAARKSQRSQDFTAMPGPQNVYKVTPPPQQPSSPSPARPASNSSGGGGLKIAAVVIGAVVAVAAIIAIIINLTQHDTSRSTASVTATTTASKTSAPERSSSTTVSSTASTGGVVTVTVQPQQAVGVVVGTCDEGGTCGVKQRDAPYAAAPRLYPDDLRDGIRVTLICQTIGDSRTSAGHGTSTVWYRLDNGAYVNSVYLAVTAGPVPMC